MLTLFDKNKKGTLTPHFIRQLNSLTSDFPRSKPIEFVLALPGNYRFPYLDKSFLLSEVCEAFEIVYQSEFKIFSIAASENDDHFIEICVSIKS